MIRGEYLYNPLPTAFRAQTLDSLRCFPLQLSICIGKPQDPFFGAPHRDVGKPKGC